MDKIKVYIKCKDKKCVICHQDIIMKDVVDDKIEISITKRKSIILIHKSCLKGR